MKIVIFSDIHGNKFAFDELMKDISSLEYDYIVFCGDIFGYYYNQEYIIKKLDKLKKLIWLKGNHDQNFLDVYLNSSLEKELVKNYGHSYAGVRDKFSLDIYEKIHNLPEYVELEINGIKIGIFHGTPDSYLTGRLYPNNEIADETLYGKYDIVILGHTHFQMFKKVGKTLVINPGSAGQPRDGRGFSYAVYDSDSGMVKFNTFIVDVRQLYHQIDRYDKDLTKLKEVLERKR